MPHSWAQLGHEALVVPARVCPHVAPGRARRDEPRPSLTSAANAPQRRTGGLAEAWPGVGCGVGLRKGVDPRGLDCLFKCKF